MARAGFPHSDTPGSQLGCQLPRAYRRLPRPSSALDAKASTMCPSQLVSQTLNKNHTRHTPHHQHTTTTHKVTAAPRQQGLCFLQKIDNHPHPTPPPPAGGRAPGRCQMLASTIHFSNTPPTNPTTHQTTSGAGKEAQKNQHTQPGGGPDSSGPNSVPKPAPPPRTPRFHSSKPVAASWLY